MSKRIIAILLASVIAFLMAGCDKADEEVSDDLFQVALLQSLMQGEYDGVISVSELKKHGDTGIGTFQSVNGEMIVLNGQVYQALGDGTVVIADDKEMVPFSNVTFFDADITEKELKFENMEGINKYLQELAEKNGKNQFYMVRAEVMADKITVRSELAQEKPYKPLKEALADDQREFTYEKAGGTIVALYCPEYMDGLNTPGWHLHFISEDSTMGGHVLDIEGARMSLAADQISGYEMCVPHRDSFDKKQLGTDMKDEIEKVEH